jgi:myosin-15
VEEYGLYIYTRTNIAGSLLRNEDYVLDLTTILDEKRIEYRLYFKKLLWYSKHDFSNNVYNNMIYDQICNDFLAGNLLTAADVDETYAHNDLPRLVCLQHLATNPQPSLQTMLQNLSKYIPHTIMGVLMDDEWAELLGELWLELQDSSPADARREFLEMVSKLEMYGSRFFELNNVSDRRINGPAVLAVNKSGITFLHTDTRTSLLKYAFSEVVSIRRLASQSSGKHFFDLKLGNLMVQRTTRCETRQSSEITAVVSWYIQAEQQRAGTLKGNSTGNLF